MAIYFFNEDVELPDLQYECVQRILKSEIRKAKFRLGVISYIFCSDEYLLAVNREFLKHDFYTDVITFDYTFDKVVTGDIYISTERVLNNSLTFDENISNEFVRVISHGLLHLLKYNDKEESDILAMRAAEDRMIVKFITQPK